MEHEYMEKFHQLFELVKYWSSKSQEARQKGESSWLEDSYIERFKKEITDLEEYLNQ